MANMTQIFVITLVVLACGIGIFTFSTSLMNSYNVVPDGNYTRTYAKLNSTFNENLSGIIETFTEGTSSPSGFGVIDGVQVVTGLALNALKLPFKIVGVVTSLFSDISSNIPGFPAWAFNLAVYLVVIVVGIAIFSAIWRHNI